MRTKYPNVLVRSLTLVMLVLLAPLHMIADVGEGSRFTYNGIRYRILSSYSLRTVETAPGSGIVGGNSVYGNIVIPEKVYCDGVEYTVTAIGDRSFYNNKLKTISIPSTVTKIGEKAFYDCTSLESITIPSSVKTMGTSVFAGCSSLKSVSVSESLTVIPNYTFEECEALDNVVIPSSVTTIEYNAFLNCSSLTSITIPNSVTEMGAGVFCGCTSLVSVELPSTITEIGSHTFKDCVSLTSMSLPAGITQIGNYAFYGCTSLTSIEIPSSETSIGDNTFEGCSKLTSIDFPASQIDSIGSYAFQNCTALKAIDLPSNLNTISSYSFNGCTALSELALPSNVDNIEEYAFYGCTGLTYLVVPSTLTAIGTNAFYGCKNLDYIINFSSLPLQAGSADYGYVAYYATNVLTNSRYSDTNGNLYLDSALTDLYFVPNDDYRLEIPSGVITIEPYAVTDKTNLESVVIPSSVQSIGKKAFANCPNLKKVFILGNTVPEGLADAFSTVEGRQAYVSSSRYSDISALGTVNVMSNLSSMFDADGVVYVPISNAARTCAAVDATYAEDATTVSIGETTLYRGLVFTVTNVYPYVLRGNPYVTTLNYTHSSTIPDEAFYNCSSLQHVTIGGDVTGFGSNPFKGVTALTSLTLEDGKSELPIDDMSLFRDGKLAELYLGRNLSIDPNDSYYLSPFSYLSTLRSLKVGATVTTINDNLFPHTSIEAVQITGNSLRTIGAQAFDHCEQLSSINSTNKAIFPSGLQVIGENAFKGSIIPSLRFPSSVSAIGTGAFDDCQLLTEVRFDDGASDLDCQCSFATTAVESAYIGRTFSDPDSYRPFENCTKLKSVEMSDYVTKLGKYCFSGCSALQLVNIPNLVTSVPDYAFNECSSLAGIEFPAAVATIGEYAFYKSGLPAVSVANTVKSVGNYAFAYNTNLQYATIDATTIGNQAFYGSGLKQVDVESNVQSIGAFAFAYCASLETANISADNIGSSAFSECTGLVSAVLADKTTTIGSAAFSGDSSLASINLPEGVTRINDNTFYNTSSLHEITLPSTLTAIGASAFEGGGLTSLIVPAATTTVSAQAFASIPAISTVTFEDSKTTIDLANTSFDSTPVTTLNINRQVNYDTTSNSPFQTNTGLTSVSMNDQPTSILKGMFQNCRALTTARVGDNVGEIGEYAFAGCWSLNTVNVPDGVAEIKAHTFNGCSSLEALTLPTSVTHLREYSLANSGLRSFVFEPTLIQAAIGSFKGCTSLQDVVAKSGSKTLEISNSADSRGMFADCPLLKVSIDRPLSYSILSEYGYSPFYRVNTLKTVELGDYPTTVPDNMFYGCSGLTDVVIGDGVTSFGNWAFSGCSSIQRFYFGGNVESIGDEAFSDCSAMVELWSKAAVPPTCGDQALADINKWDCELYVPMGTVPAYSAAEQWQDFFYLGESTGKSILPTGISLDKLSLSMEVDDNSTINAVVLPASVDSEWTPTWYSTNENVAVVANGRVTAVGAGTCQIVASLEANGTILSACDVTVKKHTQELMWVQAFGAVYVGDNVELKGKADSGLDVTYKITGGDDCAYISGGSIFFNGIGTVEVTAVQSGNAKYYASNEVVRSITVIPINPTSLALDSKVTVHVGQTLPITADIQPVNASDKTVTWRCLDESIASIDASGNLTGLVCGETYIVATASNGISATCAVRVNSLGDDYLAIDDMELGAGDTYEMPVLLTNAAEIRGAEFDLELPSSLSFVADATGMPTITLSDRASGFQLAINQLSEKTVHVEIYDFGTSTISGTSGDALAYVTVQASYSATVDLVKVTEVALYDSSYNTILAGDDNAAVTITGGGLLGDVNENGVVNTGDAIMIVSYSIGMEVAGFNVDLADVDGSGTVNTGDAIQVVNYSLGIITEFTGQSKSAMKSVGNRSAELKAESLTFENASQWQDLEISLNGFDQFTALQLNLDIPAGYEYDADAMGLTSRCDDHQLMINDRGNGSITLAVISLSLAPIAGNDGVVFTLPIRPKTDAYDIEMLHISGALAIEPDGTVHEAADSDTTIRYTQGQSGIWSVNPDDVTIYNVGHTIHVVLPQPMTVTVTTVNGQYQTYNFPAGDNQVEVPTCGVYIVSTAIKQAKISIF